MYWSRQPKAIVIITGHENADFLADTAESVRFYNPNQVVAFAIDGNKDVSKTLAKKYPVYCTDKNNGWGHGVLRTCIHAIEYFQKELDFSEIITMDSDALCVGPFVDKMVEKTKEEFFVGKIWDVPKQDIKHHLYLRDSGFLANFRFRMPRKLVAGPCMLWSRHALSRLESIGLFPPKEFDKIYPDIHFAHDQISSCLASYFPCTFGDVGEIMEIRWREPVPSQRTAKWGNVPFIGPKIAVIHPTASDNYEEKTVREYFAWTRQ